MRNLNFHVFIEKNQWFPGDFINLNILSVCVCLCKNVQWQVITHKQKYVGIPSTVNANRSKSRIKEQSDFDWSSNMSFESQRTSEWYSKQKTAELNKNNEQKNQNSFQQNSTKKNQSKSNVADSEQAGPNETIIGV